MPLYDYKCQQCGKVAEVRHGFDDRYEEPCPACGGAMQRVFSAAPIVFKGSGYYVTDSRKTGAASGSDAPAPATTATDSAPKPDAAAAPAPKKSEPAA